MPKTPPYAKPTSRPLTVYAFDPSMGRNLSNYMQIRVPYEELRPGPVGGKIAVVDYDASNKRWYAPVNLDDPNILLRGGVEPGESNPQFHQQMVYAVASETISRFETALGRDIYFRPKPGTRKDAPFRAHLRIFPHAFQQANAFYDPDLKALVFGYFPASETDAGENLPGQTVFTCLSHDIVAHETTHAVIDRIRTYFTESTSPDTPAFHEAFADIVALFQHFSMREAVIDTLNRTGGQLYKPELRPDAKPDGAPVIGAEISRHNPLVELAKQFGEAMGTRKALREALGTTPDPALLEKEFEPHSRGAILVAAVFDAFFSVYLKRTADLMRIGRAGGAVSAAGDLHPDLADRLCREAVKIAGNFLNICIRAIDYAPPVDIQFGEFLRAIITADSDLVPDDPHGYRAELIGAFRRRGIVPEDVASYGEEALRWRGPADDGKSLPPCEGLRFGVFHETDEEAAKLNADKAKKNAKILVAYAKTHAADLGLSKKGGLKIQASSFHPIHRIAPNGRLVVEFAVEFMQQRDERLDPANPKSPAFTFRGGSTVIFDHHGNVRYVVRKSIDNKSRLQRQREFQSRLGEVAALSPYQKDATLYKLDFAAIHRGF
jgi:hypothetical protein